MNKLALIKQNRMIMSLVGATIAQCRLHDCLQRKLYSLDPGKRLYKIGELRLSIECVYCREKGYEWGYWFDNRYHANAAMWRWEWLLKEKHRTSRWRHKLELLLSWEQLTGLWRYDNERKEQIGSIADNVFAIEQAMDLLDSANAKLQLILDERQWQLSDAEETYKAKMEARSELL